LLQRQPDGLWCQHIQLGYRRFIGLIVHSLCHRLDFIPSELLMQLLGRVDMAVDEHLPNHLPSGLIPLRWILQRFLGRHIQRLQLDQLHRLSQWQVQLSQLIHLLPLLIGLLLLQWQLNRLPIRQVLERNGSNLERGLHNVPQWLVQLERLIQLLHMPGG